MPETIVMTGATRGIGRVALDELARRAAPGSTFVILAREPGGSALADEMSGAGHAVVSIDTDLSSLASVRAAAARLADELAHGNLPPLRTMVANAGIQHVDDLTETVDGLESTFAVNVLANHVLLQELAPSLTAGARIVVTVSDTHFGDLRHNLGMVPGPRWPDDPSRLARIGAFPEPSSVTAGRTAYSTSKLAAIYLVHEYARCLPAGVSIVGYNPGFVPGTDLTRHAGALSRFAVRRIMPLMTLTPLATSASAAGRYLADAALGAVEVESGGYLDRNVAARSSEESYDEEREGRLWQALEELHAQTPQNKTNPAP
ncbi:SDR family NAD(P)-dependent oxidoreductase [Gordonia sp. X0973]|uniref:SDR family NAD(P)-dependent oxidoreductase n=1 Tax=Gordonia sp. X0973 TaxID=2742602 RepID=UPI002657536B|nr:SDR family NAD(P)-dependent oxidoreductase [Gordonia sp. X0973]